MGASDTDPALDPLCVALVNWLAVHEDEAVSAAPVWPGGEGEAEPYRVGTWYCVDPRSQGDEGLVDLILVLERIEGGEGSGVTDDFRFRCEATEYDQGWRVDRCKPVDL